MKKLASAGLSILVATGVAGIGGNEVQAAEQAQPKTPENSSTEQPTVKATQTTEQAITEKQQQVTEKQAIVDQKQQVADTAKKEKDTIDQSVKDQQAVANQNKDALDQSQQAVTDQQAVVDEAKKVVDEATPSAIEKAKDQVATDTQAVDDQQKVVDQAQTDVNQQQAVVDEKAKETNAAKVQNNKDQQAVKVAEKELSDTQALAKNAEAEKAKAEKEKTNQEAELTKKQAEEATAQTDKEKKEAAVATNQQAVAESTEKVTQAKAETAAKQQALATKEAALKEKQTAVKQATTSLNQSKDELKGYKGINLPAAFVPEYYKVLTPEERKQMEKEALEMNKEFPENQADAAKATEMIDVKKPTEKQKKQMSDYVVGLINDVREKFGLQKLKISNQAMKFAWDVAKLSDLSLSYHDMKAINKAAKENGFEAAEGFNMYENLGMYFWYLEVEDGEISILDFEKLAREIVVGMLFEDENSKYGHLDSLLSQKDTNMAVSISAEPEDYFFKIHIISYNQSKLVDQKNYEEGIVPDFKSKETLQKEVAINQEKLATAKEQEKAAQQERITSIEALNTAKQTQASAENDLSVKKAKLTEAQALFAKSESVYNDKTRQRKAVETQLQATNDKLVKIQALIDNRSEVLKEAETKVAEAQAVEATSAKVLKEKQAAQQAEEIVLAHLTDIYKQRQADVAKAKQQLARSQQVLSRLENAQPTYEKALNELNKAEAAVVQAQEAYENSLKSLEELKEQQAVAALAYAQAQEDLSNAKLELQQYQGVLRDLEAQQAEQQRQEALQEQVAKEQQRLEREATQNQTLVASATSADKTPGLQQLSFSKQKEQPKAQSLTHSESRKTKQVVKAQETLPHTGEQESIWLTIMGLFMAAGAISFKNKKRKKNS